MRVGNVLGIGHYPRFFDRRLGVRPLALADRSPLVPTAAAFVGGGDYAILMLVARLGLRSIEAARLQVDDLDWRAGRSVLRGTASGEDGIPLPADVVEVLSACLRQACPATDRQM